MQFSKTIVVSLLVSAGLFSNAAHATTLPPSPTPTIAPSFPAWDSASTYNAGQRVTQNGTTYEAQWWTKGDSPATAGAWGAWKVIGNVQVTPTPIPSATPTAVTTPSATPSTSPTITATPATTISPNSDAWNTSTVYTAGKRATYNGRIYEAKWYTVGENPSTTGEWGVWKDLGAIATPTPSPATPSPTPATTFAPVVGCAAGWEPSKTYTAGSVVSLQLANGTCGVKINNYGALLGGSAQKPDGSPTTWKLLNTCALSGCPTPSATPFPTPSATPTASPTPASGTVLQLETSKWKNGATAAYTMFHDDLGAWITDGQIDFAAPALKARGLVAAFGVISGSAADKHWIAAKQFIADGNEIFSHSRSHTDANSATWDAAAQIAGSSDDIAAHLDGYRPSFFAWPSDVAADAPLAYLRSAAGYIGGRAANRVDASGMVVYDGHAGGVNAAPASDSYQVRWDLYTDQGQWSAYEAQVKAGGDLLNLHVDAAIANGGWATRTMHGVNDTSWMTVPLAKYTAHLDYIKAKVDLGLLWVAGPSDVIKYRYARDFCKASLISTTSIPASQSIAFETTSPECKKYATPITIKVVHSNSKLKATQDGKALVVTAGKFLSGDMLPITRYDFITVHPLAGAVSLSAE